MKKAILISAMFLYYMSDKRVYTKHGRIVNIMTPLIHTSHMSYDSMVQIGTYPLTKIDLILLNTKLQ